MRRAFAIFCVGWTLVVAVLLGMAVSPTLDGEFGRFWVPVFTGNWTPATDEAYAAEHPHQAALAQTLALLLNNALIFGALGAVWIALSRGRRSMRLAQALALKQAEEFDIIITELGLSDEQVDRVMGRLGEAEEAWRKRLTAIVGPDAAAEIARMVEETEVPAVAAHGFRSPSTR